MSRFSYTAEKAGGESYSGVAEAHDRFELYSIVRREGGHIISITERNEKNWFSFKYWNAKFSTVKEHDKILFARNLGAMLSAGLALARSLSVMERQSRNPKLSETMSEIASEVRRGATLHEALAKFPSLFSKLFVAMVRAGEEGGSLPDSLSVLSDQMERMYQLKKKVRSALIYPAIIIIAIIGIGALMMIYVVPTLANTFKEMGTELPISTKLIIGVSDFLVQNTLLAALLLIILGALAYMTMRSAKGKRVMDFVCVHTPLIGEMVKEVNAARTARTMSSLLQSGVDVIASLEIAQEVVQNSYFKEVIAEASIGVRKGETLSSAFVRREDLYPAFVGEMMAVGEETGASAEMLKRLAVFYEDEVDRKTKDMSTIIEPLLMVFIGGAVGFFAVSMITPIYQISQNI